MTNRRMIMKKRLVLATVLCTLFAFTGCGSETPADAGNTNDSGAAQTEDETPADETPADTDENGSDSAPSADMSDLAGTWFEADVLDSRTLIIAEDGSFTLEYRGGGALYGTVEVVAEENPDDTENYWYSFIDQEGDVWESVCIPDDGIQDDLYFGQGGDPHFIREGAVSYPVTLDVIGEDYLGNWQCDRCGIEITENADGYIVDITWANSASETVEWIYVCYYDSDMCALVSEEQGTKQVLVTEDGNTETIVEYSDGTGSFFLDEGILTWTDDAEHQGDGMEFERIG